MSDVTRTRKHLGKQRQRDPADSDHDPITGTDALHALTDPVTTPTGTRVPGLRLGQQRAHALPAALLVFRLLPHGFTNRDLRAVPAGLRGLRPDQVSPGQMTYDLRRLRTHGLIERVPRSHRYPVTDPGLHTAMFLTRVHDRLLPTGLATLAGPWHDGPLRSAANTYRKAIDTLARDLGLAAGEKPDPTPRT